jgi:cation diffusion facilitator CzcD-associated flavoprotein CzcO
MSAVPNLPEDTPLAANGTTNGASVPPPSSTENFRPLRVIVIGAGYSGIYCGIRIPEKLRNVELVIYEKNEGVGGTWYENRYVFPASIQLNVITIILSAPYWPDYPGILAVLAIYLVRCAHAIVDLQADITPAHSYQFSFEPNHSWSALYAPAREIQAYLERTAKKYSADRFIKLAHQITECRWDDKTAKWHVQVKNLKTGEVLHDKADVLISARGNLNNPAWPEIEGLQTFKGEVMHSAKWNERCGLNS